MPAIPRRLQQKRFFSLPPGRPAARPLPLAARRAGSYTGGPAKGESGGPVNSVSCNGVARQPSLSALEIGPEVPSQAEVRMVLASLPSPPQRSVPHVASPSTGRDECLSERRSALRSGRAKTWTRTRPLPLFEVSQKRNHPVHSRRYGQRSTRCVRRLSRASFHGPRPRQRRYSLCPRCFPRRSSGSRYVDDLEV